MFIKTDFLENLQISATGVFFEISDFSEQLF